MKSYNTPEGLPFMSPDTQAELFTLALGVTLRAALTRKLMTPEQVEVFSKDYDTLIMALVSGKRIDLNANTATPEQPFVVSDVPHPGDAFAEVGG